MAATRTPIWQSIRDTLIAEVAEGRYAPGDRLPTEAALAKRFGVNRHTVRRALAALAETGVVHSRRGAGVFVTQRPTEYPIGRRVRFHRNLEAAGRMPARKVLSLETRQSDAREAEALALDPGARVLVYEGISLADEQPVALFSSIFPAARLPRMAESLNANPSVTAALRDHGIADYTRAWTRLTAKLATATQALHLHLREGDPILRTVAVNVDVHDTPMEYGRTWFAGDRVTLTLSDS
ncbi:phosphonate metabolism transcriptional regulator PhnF [Roseovarius salinarum]|uniref:phosphonate metabolism transcriptional regulator PhnF n=1 Tax=Roseovarius salinarum TaxID=1981892 RepID=UPI000C34D243|nr:phosphonate metabolism transcriptional regulator PhnF [Roseovarius salinarum]